MVWVVPMPITTVLCIKIYCIGPYRLAVAKHCDKNRGLARDLTSMLIYHRYIYRNEYKKDVK